MKIQLLAAAALTLISGCATDLPTTNEPLAPPQAETVRSIAINAYRNTMHRAETNLQITKVQQITVFVGISTDFLVCVSTTETFTGNWYNNAGQVTRHVDDPYTQSWVMLMREYPQGWGSGIFRRVEEGKIGHVRMADVCPASQQ